MKIISNKRYSNMLRRISELSEQLYHMTVQRNYYSKELDNANARCKKLERKRNEKGQFIKKN